MMQYNYECQICRYSAEQSPPEWCPVCGGHRIIFKRLVPVKESLLYICGESAR